MMTKTSVQGIIGALEGIRDRPDSVLLLNQISCPVLIVHGTDDKIVPMNEAELMERKISHSHLVKIKDAGHLPNLEQPVKYNQAIRDFLRSLA
jgi:pimeloyl-ACP methyl ester carboxylesterase